MSDQPPMDTKQRITPSVSSPDASPPESKTPAKPKPPAQPKPPAKPKAPAQAKPAAKPKTPAQAKPKAAAPAKPVAKPKPPALSASQRPAATAQTLSRTPVRRPRKNVWGWLVGVILLIGGGLAAFAVIGTVSDAQTREAVQAAEAHYELAVAYYESASTEIEQSDTSYSEVLELAETKLVSGHSELESARSIIAGLDNSEGKNDYLASIESAALALDGTQAVLDGVRLASELSDALGEGSDLSAGEELLQQAIGAGNDGDYRRMRTKAQAASKKYAEALASFTRVSDAAQNGELDAVIKYAQLRKKQADLAVPMAADGLANRLSKYNSKAAQSRKLHAQADELVDRVNDVDTEWIDSAVTENREYASSIAGLAKDEHASALEEFGL